MSKDTVEILMVLKNDSYRAFRSDVKTDHPEGVKAAEKAFNEATKSLEALMLRERLELLEDIEEDAFLTCIDDNVIADNIIFSSTIEKRKDEINKQIEATEARE